MTEPDYDTRLKSMVRRFERLAARIKEGTLASDVGLEAFVQYQEDIFDFQIDVQVALSELKPKLRSNKAARAFAGHLRRLRWYSRRLGDAIAWGFFANDKQRLSAFSHNELAPVPLSKESDGIRGIWLAARSSIGPAWGIPLVHDITSCLRVGDITFLNVDPRDMRLIHRTVEIKTHRTSVVPVDDTHENITLQVTFVGNEPFPENLPLAEDPPPLAPEAKRWREDPRFKRQMDRLDLAVRHRDAKKDGISEIGDSFHITLQRDDVDGPRWAELRSAIRQAHRAGYAFFSIDGYVGYSVHYNPNGVKIEDMATGTLMDDVVSQMTAPGGHENSITIQSVPIQDEDVGFAAEVMPFYLYKIPQRAIRELIRGELMIMAYLNIGHVAAALENLGLTIVRRDGAKDSRSFWVETRLQWPDGRSFKIEQPAPWREVQIAMHEFLGIDSAIASAKAVLDIPNRIPYEEFDKSIQARMRGETAA
jgi:hypothetical protein